MSPEIRQIREEDIGSFRSAVDVVARERQYLYLTEAPPLEELQTMVRGVLAKGTPLIVLSDGGDVVGWCNIFSLPRAVQAHVGVVAMGLRPEWRDQGWGTRLMQTALGNADVFGFTRIELTVLTSNPRAAALYRKFDFVEEGIKNRSVRIGETYFDEIMMARLKPAHTDA
jgi:RimJ/RimL family protein N-acetyltransferase